MATTKEYSYKIKFDPHPRPLSKTWRGEKITKQEGVREHSFLFRSFTIFFTFFNFTVKFGCVDFGDFFGKTHGGFDEIDTLSAEGSAGFAGIGVMGCPTPRLPYPSPVFSLQSSALNTAKAANTANSKPLTVGNVVYGGGGGNPKVPAQEKFVAVSP